MGSAKTLSQVPGKALVSLHISNLSFEIDVFRIIGYLA